MSEDRINALVDAMTVEETIALLAGKDSWTTVPIPRLGIPSIKVSDGPNGARGGGAFIGGVTAAAFPVAISLSSSWDVELVGEIGAALADEARSKGARVLLAPTVNMHRSTRERPQLRVLFRKTHFLRAKSPSPTSRGCKPMASARR